MHSSTNPRERGCRRARDSTRTRRLLDAAAIDRHRALASIGEELEAVDWYDQRAEATDERRRSRSVLAHNRDEEKEHAAMTLEWLRRNDPVLDRHLRTYLFTEGSIVAEEAAAEHDADGAVAPTRPAHGHQPAGPTADGSLGIGSLKEHRLVTHLFRELAPVSTAAWSEIETEAKRALENFLAARRLVDFSEPVLT